MTRVRGILTISIGQILRLCEITGGSSSRGAARAAVVAKRVGTVVGSLSLLTVAGCNSVQPPPRTLDQPIARPSGQLLVMEISSGRVGSLRWHVEVVGQDDKLCTQAVVSGQIMATECRFTVGPDLPVNFEVEGNSEILFVDGVVGAAVSRLTSVTVQDPQGVDLKLAQVSGHPELRYFGYALRPGDAVDLLGFDPTGAQIYSGGDKIRGTFDGRRASPLAP
jgi:hypothetical protein